MIVNRFYPYLGTEPMFLPDSDSMDALVPSTDPELLHVFISYSRRDLDRVKKLLRISKSAVFVSGCTSRG